MHHSILCNPRQPSVNKRLETVSQLPCCMPPPAAVPAPLDDEYQTLECAQKGKHTFLDQIHKGMPGRTASSSRCLSMGNLHTERYFLGVSCSASLHVLCLRSNIPRDEMGPFTNLVLESRKPGRIVPKSMPEDRRRFNFCFTFKRGQEVTMNFVVIWFSLGVVRQRHS